MTQKKTGDNTSKKKLYLRFSTSDDVKAIIDFYQSNEHEYVAHRDIDIMKERIESGAVTIVECKDGKIHAASISYAIEKDGEHKWTEVGSTRISLNGLKGDGYSLFDVLVSAQKVRAFLLEPPEDHFVIEIDVDNKSSQFVFERLGCQSFDNAPPEITEAAESTMAPEDTGVPIKWYQFGLEGIPGLAKNLINSSKKPILIQKGTGIEYELDFSKNQLNIMFKEHIKHLSKQDFCNITEQNSNKGLAKGHGDIHRKIYKP